METFITVLTLLFWLGILALNIVLVVVFLQMAKDVKSILGFIKSNRAMKLDGSKWMCPICGSMNFHNDKYCQSCSNSIFGY